MKLKDEIIQECYQFAVDVTETTFKLYSRRNPNLTKKKAIHDHFKAKLTEQFVYEYLTKNNYTCSKPDFTQLTKDKKSYDADLCIIGTGIEIHVKSCKPELHSVLFERDEVDIMLKKNNQYIVIVEYRSPLEMRILAFRGAKDFQFKPPIKPMPSKLAIYL